MKKRHLKILLLFCFLTNNFLAGRSENKSEFSSLTTIRLQDELKPDVTFQECKWNDIEFSSTYLVIPYLANKNSIPSLSFSYYHRIMNKLWIGAILTYNNVTPMGLNVDNEGLILHENDYSFLGIAPTVRFSYICKSQFLLYSGLAVGLQTIYRSEKWNIENIPYFQATLIGFSYGKHLYVGGEFGLGFKGFLNINVGYKF